MIPTRIRLPARLLAPAVAVLALAACANEPAQPEVALASATDLQTVSSRVGALENQVQQAQQAADRAQAAAERAQAAAERIEALYRQGQRK